MASPREPNERLRALISETGLSGDALARLVKRVAAERGERLQTNKSTVSQWISGRQPSGNTAAYLAEALSRALRGRVVTPTEIGLPEHAAPTPDWHTDTLTALAELGRADVHMERRRALGMTVYSVAALGLPDQQWWDRMADSASARRDRSTRRVGSGDLDAVRDMTAMFSTVDQRRGGAHAWTAVVQYLTTDVTAYLHGGFTDDRVRRGLFTTAAELAYLAGWMAFDSGRHAVAQHYFTQAVKLAAEADDAPMAAHVLRAMAHQAIDLGHPDEALGLAAASVAGDRYRLATPRERALLGVVHARSLAAAGRRHAAGKALLRAEDDLASAHPDIGEPDRVFFFGEASLAHETACALRDMGDLDASVREFRRSVRTRRSATFTRTHAVTLGYLGAVHARMKNIDEACATWSKALDAMEGVRSGRTRQAAAEMRSLLSPYRRRGTRATGEVDARAAAYLSATT
ncbi:helix-turn-helix transcriptional regulator [Kitasatospora cinereorecta]|uniref:Helix-turn-helix domain-containing protein n=1 Tax=Kitasatospora cinereorecta TaxID=285560 RepID=A0ABW0V499_9ACTN